MWQYGCVARGVVRSVRGRRRGYDKKTEKIGGEEILILRTHREAQKEFLDP